MKTSLIMLAAPLAGCLATPAPASGCAPREVVVERLAERYGESRRSIGLGASGAMMEVFASDRTGTWTITVTTAQGLTCLMASGEAFEPLPKTCRTRAATRDMSWRAPLARGRQVTASQISLPPVAVSRT